MCVCLCYKVVTTHGQHNYWTSKATKISSVNLQSELPCKVNGNAAEEGGENEDEEENEDEFKGRKQLKERLGMIDRMEKKEVLTERSERRMSGYVGWCIRIIKNRNVFAYGVTDTFKTAPALTAGRLTVLGRCEAQHSDTFKKWHLTRIVCVCMCVHVCAEGTLHLQQPAVKNRDKLCQISFQPFY